MYSSSMHIPSSSGVLLLASAALISAFSSRAEDYYSCDNSYYGTEELRCQEVMDGRVGGDALFTLDHADLCLMKAEQEGYYFKGHIGGTYVGGDRSEDAIFPDYSPSAQGREVHHYQQGDAIEAGHSNVLLFQDDASWDGELMEIEEKEDRGQQGYYQTYRDQVWIDWNTGIAHVTLERNYGNWIFSDWRKIYSARLMCVTMTRD